MGLFSSSYKAQGSAVFNPIGKARNLDDTYLGEVLLENTRTGKNFSQNIRDEIFKNQYARMRQYNKLGNQLGFGGKLNFNHEFTPNDYKPLMQAYTQVHDVVSFEIGYIDEKFKSFAELSQTINYREISGVFTGGGLVNEPYFAMCDGLPSHPEFPEYINNIQNTHIRPDSENNMFLYGFFVYYKDMKVHNFWRPTDLPFNNYPICNDDPWHVNPPDCINLKKGFLAKYHRYPDDDAVYYFYSEEPEFMVTPSHSTSIDMTPVISLQDNENGEQPYHLLPVSDERYLKRMRCFRALNIDFKELGDKIFNPDPIPDVGTGKWYKDYGKAYYDNDELMEEYPTEEEYHDHLVEDQEQMLDNIDNITDVHFGLFASMKTLKDANIIALLYTLMPILTQTAFVDNPWEGGHLLPEDEDDDTDDEDEEDEDQEPWKQIESILVGSGYAFGIESGSLIMDYKILDYSLQRRIGVVKNESDHYDDCKYRRHKKAKEKHCSYSKPCKYPEAWDFTGPERIVNKKKKTSFRIITGDCATLRSNEIEVGVHHPDNIMVYPSDLDGSNKDFFHHKTNEYCFDYWKDIEDKVSAASDAGATGYPDVYDTSRTVLELCVQQGLDHLGRPVYYELRLFGLRAEHIVDVQRDGEYGRSASVVVGSDLLNIDDVEYSDGVIFPVTMSSIKEIPIFRREHFWLESAGLIINGIEVTKVRWYQKGWFQFLISFIGMVLGGYTEGASLAVTVVTKVLTKLIGKFLHIPEVVAIIVAAASAAMSGYLEINTLVMMVEATGTYIQTYIAQETIKLQQEYKAFRESVNERQEELNKLEEEFGLNGHDDSGWVLWLATLPPVEYPDEFFDRTLNQEVFVDVDNLQGRSESELPRLI